MRIRGDSTFGRLTALACAVLNLGVAGAVPILDALLESAAREAPELHIEAETRHPCAPGHDELFCQLCRAQDRQVVAGTRASTPPLRGRVVATCSAPLALFVPRPAAASNEARAPPNAPPTAV